MGRRSWTTEQLKTAVAESFSVRQVIARLGLIPAGGNYQQVNRYIVENGFDTSHFLGSGWRKGKSIPRDSIFTLEQVMTINSYYSLYRLKQRLFKKGIKRPKCEECGWARVSSDGRIPIELDHINGDRHDNRLQNLRILCPNCHSLKPTHRGRNKGRRGGEIGQTRDA